MKRLITFFYVILSTFLIGYLFFSLRSEKSNSSKFEQAKKNQASNYDILTIWMSKQIKNVDVFRYFNNNKIGSIAIYGFGTIGMLLFDRLSRCPEVDIKYIIDQNIKINYKGTEIIPIEKIMQQEQVDAIIVTPHFAFNAIENDLKPHTDAKIISFLEILVS